MVLTKASTSASASASSSAPSPETSGSIAGEPSDAAASEAGSSSTIDASLPVGAVAFGPATLTGKLVEQTFFGPPGYGADPAHDKKELVLVLELAQTIDVVRPPSAPATGVGEFDVDRTAVAKVSLTDPKDAGTDLHKLVGQHIVVKGTLFGAHTAHHHTDVLMSGVEVVAQ